MNKGSRKQGDLARRSPTQSLDHTANRRPQREPLPLSTVRYPLMRTVLGDRMSPRIRPPAGAFQPSRASPAAVVRGSTRARSTAKRLSSPFLQSTLLMQSVPERAMVCARRHIRREVLFATKRTGGKGARRPRSKVRC